MRKTHFFILVSFSILSFFVFIVPQQSSKAATFQDFSITQAEPRELEKTIVVNSIADSGPGSFRNALEAAKAGFTILFDPVVFPMGAPASIEVLTPLPAITQGGLIIDAGGAGVILDGSRIDLQERTSGLSIRSNGNIIRGMQIMFFSRSAIEITMGSQQNIIGGTTDADRNIISGNLIGIVISGTGTMNNTVSGNYIGTDATGTVANGNDECGIWIGEGASNNLIGGSTPNERNIISGNEHSGIIIDNGSNNTISGNYIGVDVSGRNPLGNGYMGVMLIWGSQYNQVGGSTAGERNIISANVATGVDLTNTGTNSNTISGNYIGTDISGVIPLGNGGSGIALHIHADNNIIGGGDASPAGGCSAECNLVSGNEGDGIWIGTDGNSIAGNYIGTDVSGEAPIGNRLSGVHIEDGGSSNRIGPANIIAYNTLDGITMSSETSTANTLTINSIHDNAGSGIQIAEGANSGLEPPQITFFNAHFIRGRTEKDALVEVFSDRSGQGQYFEDSTQADGDGDFSFSFASASFRGSYFTLVVTDTDGNTSRFTLPVIINTPRITRALPGILSPTQVSLDLKVIGTNLALAVFSVFFFGFTSTVFNSILESYHLEFVGMMKKLVPERFRNRKKGQDGAELPPAKAQGRLFRRWLLVILLTTIIESFLDPGVSLLGIEYIGILITLFLSAAIVSAFELGSGVYARRRWAPALTTMGSVQWLGLLIAVGCVLVSRIMQFTPGYLYGIIGAVVLLPEIEDDARSGKKGSLVLAVIFLGGLLFWIASIFLPNALVELEPIFLTIFLMCLQGVFFKLWPLSTTDGGDIWKWKKPVWAVFFSIAFFCFYHFILNPTEVAVEAFQQNGVQTLLVLLAVFGLATLTLWLLFPYRLGKKEAQEG